MDTSAFLSNVWSIVLVALFFGGSIFVHELGHFWVARRRGVKVERFSIGFGPAICKWTGRDGVEYRLSWIPLGGYVAQPQLADLSAVEGKAEGSYADLPPPSYTTKVLVFVAGAAFNILFALLLCTVIWWKGVPEAVEPSPNQIGYVAKEIRLPDGTTRPSPAAVAGLQPGDIILSIDGREVKSWSDISAFVMLGAGRTETDAPQALFRIQRAETVLDIPVQPALVTTEKIRRVGIGPSLSLAVGAVDEGSAAAKAGFQPGDLLLSVGGQRLYGDATLVEALEANPAPTQAEVLRAGELVTLNLPAVERFEAKTFGLALKIETRIVHPSPFTQVWEHATLMFRNLQSWLHPKSDVDLSKFSGPVGIFRMFHQAASDSWLTLLVITALINVNLALFNLLPLPVLDGGHIVLATIAKLRGRPVPVETVATLQSGFMLLLLSTALYVTFFDVRRIVKDPFAPPPPAQTAPTPTPTPVP